MLLYVNDLAFGHCTTHSVSMSSESKDRQVKPAASVEATGMGLWKAKNVTGLSVSISGEGLVFSGEEESSYALLLNIWKSGLPVGVKCMQRGASDPYLTGNFVITSLERSDPAGDDATYSVTLENAGEVTFDTTAFYIGSDGDIVSYTGDASALEPNVTQTVGTPVSVPTFSPDSWASGSTLSVTLSCATTGADIYYTIDGSKPTKSSTKYTSSISLSATKTIKAVAYKSGVYSIVVSKTYTKPS